LGIEAAKAVFWVNFANASILVERLARAEKEKKLEDKIRGLSKFQLLIIDEIGYLPFDELGAHCSFQLISRRYEKASTIFTSSQRCGGGPRCKQAGHVPAAALSRIKQADPFLS
jgi:DNA replication protein DnaC